MEGITALDGHSVPFTLRLADRARSTCVIAHGITANRSEGGIYDRQAGALIDAGISTLQIDFRGHGESVMPSEQMTARGEVFDLTAAIEAIAAGEIFLLAASFGAVAAALLPKETKSRIARVCLWNPVVDPSAMLFAPSLPWQMANFGEERIEAALARSSRVQIAGANGPFLLGPTFFDDARTLDVRSGLKSYGIPMLLIHGDADTYVSYEDARHLALEIPNASFVSVPLAEHGFHNPQDEASVIARTTDFFCRPV